MKEATSSHDLKGLRLIGDLYVLAGMGLILASILFTQSFILVVLFFMGMGIACVGIGHYLDDLRTWAWGGAIISNIILGSSMIYSISTSPFQIGVSLVYQIAYVVFTIGIIVYLLRPTVRNLFFKP
jgi:hypothetical protein